ncbi:MAG: YicC family protein [Phycisphaerales bacterium]|nr:YicC family protein [Phycisphaerales bacterium]
MVRSMTGFGIAQAELDGALVAVEVRSVNNRHFKCTLRIPEDFTALESEIEAQAARRLVRGSAIVTLRISNGDARISARINGARLNDYITQLAETLGAEAAARIDRGQLLLLPGVVVEDGGAVFLERLRPIALKLLDEACDKVMVMRTREGENLRQHLVEFGKTIRTRIESITRRVPAVVVSYQARLRQRVDAMLAEIGSSVDPADLLREVAIFAERSDIAEEVARLTGHLDQYESLLSPTLAEPIGRTMDFVAQELLREANTIASKSADVEISRQVVEIKTAIDRIKEQAANAE